MRQKKKKSATIKNYNKKLSEKQCYWLY